MSIRESRTLQRDIEATAIPYGEKVPLKAGSTLFVMQALGGSYTAMSDQGYMVRIEGRDADAIGETPVAVAVGAGSVWVANEFDGSVSRIDPATNAVVAIIRIGGAPQGIAVSGNTVWVSVAEP